MAQTNSDLRGIYKRYGQSRKGKQAMQTLTLSGASSGRYTLTEEGSETPDYTSGCWIKSKIWAHNRDSLQVVVLDYENEYETRYFLIQPTGCLTPVYDDGEQIRRANSFAPVKNSWVNR